MVMYFVYNISSLVLVRHMMHKVDSGAITIIFVTQNFLSYCLIIKTITLTPNH
jgi:hypothetical protein